MIIEVRGRAVYQDTPSLPHSLPHPLIPSSPHPLIPSPPLKKNTHQVSELLEKTSKELGCSLELTGFIKYRTGEE